MYTIYAIDFYLGGNEFREHSQSLLLSLAKRPKALICPLMICHAL